jgi:hypothetical protein
MIVNENGAADLRFQAATWSPALCRICEPGQLRLGIGAT